MSRSFRIGRDKSCDIPIADDSVSRVHAEFTVANGKILLSDCGSSNGTHIFRNNQRQRITQVSLTAGDKVQFGTVTLTVEQLLDAIGAKAAPRSAPAPARLVRCGCGAVKTANQSCPECKQ
jgi:pSer/pThr/pTyr-binding forkhead associated (FHA) protein